MKQILPVSHLFSLGFFSHAQDRNSIVFGLYKSKINSNLKADKYAYYTGCKGVYKDVYLLFNNYGIITRVKFYDKFEVLFEMAFMNFAIKNNAK